MTAKSYKEENMQELKPGSLSRRKFIATASGLMIGSAFFPLPSPLRLDSQVAQKAEGELSAEDLEWIKKSSMAKELNKYFGQGYSCAESAVMVSLRFLDMSEEFVWAAAGFGGGLYHKNLCGFLTGGIMGIGFASSLLEKPRREAKTFCGDTVKEYWKWWESRFPLHCSEIRTEGRDSRICLNLGLLSMAKIEELIKAVKKST
jgi:hypothetical protein